MAHARFEDRRITPEAITSGYQIEYLQKTAGLPARLQAVMMQLVSKTEWYLAKHRGYLQTKPVCYQELARDLQCSVRTAIRSIRELKELGQVVVHERFGAGGHQIMNIFTLPKLRDYLASRAERVGGSTPPSGSTTLKVPTEGHAAGADHAVQTRGDTHGIPKRQTSSSKKNTYLKIRNIWSREEFLALDASASSSAPILKIIKKNRPDADPTVIYGYFRQFISKPGFKLASHFPNFFALLGYFAKTCRLISAKPTPRRETAPPSPPPLAPEGNDLEARVRQQLHRLLGGYVYATWFSNCQFELGDRLVIVAPNAFAARYISEHMNESVDHAAAAFGLRPYIHSLAGCAYTLPSCP